MLLLGILAASLVTCGRPLASITLSAVNLSIPVGSIQRLIATGTYSDGTSYDISTQVTWASSNTSVATVDTTGLVTALAAGTANITAQGTNLATSGAVSGSYNLTVYSATLSSIAVTPTNPTLPAGVTQQFRVIGTFSDGTLHEMPPTQIAWISLGAATIDSGSGLATAGVAAGTAIIIATTEGISGSTTLTVTSATLSSAAVTPTNPIIPMGVAQQFTAIGTFSDGTSHDITTQVTWSSSNPLVATVNSSGLVTVATSAAVNNAATITATLGSISGSTTITVTAATLSSLVVTPGIFVGSTQQFQALGWYSDGGNQDITTQVSWSSSNPSVATINSGGLATGVSPGTATITAAKDGAAASLAIRVISD